MKTFGKFYWAALFSLWLGVCPLQARAEDYQGMCQEGRCLVSEFKLEKANGKAPDFSHKDKAYQAGDLFLAAAEAAPNEDLRFQALMQAGEAYSQSYSLKDEAVEAYKKARALTSVSGEQRGVAAWEVARHSRKAEDYEYLLTIPGAAPKERAQALEALASQAELEAKQEPALHLKYIDFIEKAVPLWATFDLSKANTQLGIAEVRAESVPEALHPAQVIDRLYKTQLSLPYSGNSRPLYEAMRKNRWGESLAKVKAYERALAVWGELGANSSYSPEQREAALVKAADLESSRGHQAQALVWLEKAAPLRADNYVFAEKIGLKRLDLLEDLHRDADAVKVLNELSGHSGIAPARQEQLEIEKAKLLLRMGKKTEAEKILQSAEKSPRRGGATVADVAITRAQAALDAKDPAQARRILDAGVEEVFKLKDFAAYGTLQRASGQAYRKQGDYLKAMEAFSLGSRDAYGRIVPTQDVLDSVRRMLTESIQAGKLADSLSILNKAKQWAIHPILKSMMEAEYLTAKSDGDGARAAIALAKSQLVYFQDGAKDYLRKEIERLEAAIPPK